MSAAKTPEQSSTRDPVGHAVRSLTARTPIAEGLPLSLSMVETISTHGLIGAAYLEGPADLQGLVQPAYVRSQARQGVMNLHRKALVEALADAGIAAVVLKGQSVARWYDDSRIRTSTDIDLLVRREQVNHALTVLDRYPRVVDVPPQGPKADKRHVMVADESGVSFLVDLHWHLYSYHQLRGRADDALGAVWNGISESELGWELPLAAELTFLACHAVLDHRFRLVLFRDLAELARSDVDWDEVIRFAQAHGLASVTFAALNAAVRFARADIPGGALRSLRTRSLAETLFVHQLARVDPVRFNGHAVHPLNLGAVLLHDDLRDRVALAARAPTAIGHWRRRTKTLPVRRPKRVLVLITTNQRRGAEVFGEALSAELEERGWDVRLKCLSVGTGAEVRAEPLEGASDELGRLSPELVRALRRAMRDVDVVLANGSATLRYTAAASLVLPGAPSLVYSSIGEPAYWADSSNRRALMRLLLGKMDFVGAVSHATERQLVDHIGLDPLFVRYTPTGVSHTPTGVSHEPSEGVESPATGPLRIVWIGSLSAEKRPLLALDVLDGVDREVELAIVGDGPLMAEVAKRAAADPRVTIVGSTSSVSGHLLWADVLLQTSATEGLPGVVMEAAAFGVPSLAFDVGGTNELVLDGATGWLATEGDVVSMTQVLAELADDRRVLVVVGNAARHHVSENFSLDAAVDRWEQLLESAIETRRHQ